VHRRQCGRTDLTVSRLGLGTWTWAHDTGTDVAAAQLRTFLDAGGTLVDTAAAYGDGRAEELLGTVLRTAVRRDEVVIATKAGAADVVDTSRRAMLSTLDDSLRRLGTDHVDLWQVHAWSDTVPVAETLGALDEAVRSGRCRHVGICNYAGWQAARAATVQQLTGAAPLATHQTQYSLLHREPEREVVPAARALGTGVLAWSPLAGGVLSGKYRQGTPAGTRATVDRYVPYLRPFLDDADADAIVSAVCLTAGALGRSPAEVALAWVRDRPGVTAALIGARTGDQLRTALDSESLDLPDEITELLDDAS
jgi:aryl-alcohol dehydrogenase-like predicted oxidoreductase